LIIIEILYRSKLLRESAKSAGEKKESFPQIPQIFAEKNISNFIYLPDYFSK